MRKFSGITTILSPEAMCSDNIQSEQKMAVNEKAKYSPVRIGMNFQPYRTEFRNIYK